MTYYKEGGDVVQNEPLSSLLFGLSVSSWWPPQWVLPPNSFCNPLVYKANFKSDFLFHLVCNSHTHCLVRMLWSAGSTTFADCKAKGLYPAEDVLDLCWETTASRFINHLWTKPRTFKKRFHCTEHWTCTFLKAAHHNTQMCWGGLQGKCVVLRCLDTLVPRLSNLAVCCWNAQQKVTTMH